MSRKPRRPVPPGRGAGAGGRASRLRAFVGIPLPEVLAAGYAGIQSGLRDLARVKWVERQNLHLTLKFLGDVEQESVPRLAAALARVGAGSAPAILTAARVTAFPSEQAARILVVELADPSGTLVQLQQAVERELAAAGVPPEERPFRLHLTLGRVREGKADARAALAALAPPRGEWRVDRFQLIESRLGPAGPTYTVLESFPMG